MTAGEQRRSRRAGEIFDAVVDLPGHRRQAAMDALCAGDAALRAQVEALLAADAGTAEPFAGDAARWGRELAGPAPVADLSGRCIGAWQITGVLGHGGMGVVHEVQRVDRAYRQRAALKLIRIGADSPAARERFLRERQTLAQLQHPSIATLLDGGFTGDGDPYFVMEYVDGQPIDAWCDARALDLRARTELFVQVLDAVQYAHRNLVVHRDLKPSNILVDGDGRVKLLDFGVAKQLDDGDAGTVGERAMTLEYASPEQLDAAPITTATDVWQLGVVLYRLLSGAHPFGIERDTPLARQLQQLGGEPAPLARAGGAVDGAVAAARGHSPATLGKALRGDLSNIVHGCLRRVPEQRYRSVEALADDLRRWRAHQPLRVVAPGRWKRAGLWLQRNRVLAAGGGVAALALLAGTGLALWQAGEARRQGAHARQALQLLGDTLAAASPDQALGPRISVRELLDRARSELDRRDAVAVEVRQPVQRMLAELYHALGEMDTAVALFEPGFAGVEPRDHEQALALARALGQYAGALDEVGRGGESLALHRRAAEWRARFAADDPEQQLRSLVGLGSGHYAARDRAAAIDFWRRAIDQGEAMPDPPREPLFAAYHMLAGTLNGEGEQAQALALADRALARADADGLPALSSTRVLLLRHKADALQGMGEAVAAEALIREAIAVRERLAGDGGTWMASLQGTLGLVLNAQGRYREALVALEHADALGTDDPMNTAIGLNNRASIHESAGDYPGALALFERAIARLDQGGVGADDAWRRQIELNRARSLVLAGRFGEADARLRDLQARARALDGEGSLAHGMATWQRVLLARRRGDVEQGLPLLAQSRAIFGALVPDTHAIFAHALRAEAEFEQARADPAAAERAQREAVARLESDGSGGLDLAIARAELAGLLLRRGDRGAAREQLAPALPALREAVLPTEVSRARAEALARQLQM